MLARVRFQSTLESHFFELRNLLSVAWLKNETIEKKGMRRFNVESLGFSV